MSYVDTPKTVTFLLLDTLPQICVTVLPNSHKLVTPFLFLGLYSCWPNPAQPFFLPVLLPPSLPCPISPGFAQGGLQTLTVVRRPPPRCPRLMLWAGKPPSLAAVLNHCPAGGQSLSTEARLRKFHSKYEFSGACTPPQKQLNETCIWGSVRAHENSYLEQSLF